MLMFCMLASLRQVYEDLLPVRIRVLPQVPGIGHCFPTVHAASTSAAAVFSSSCTGVQYNYRCYAFVLLQYTAPFDPDATYRNLLRMIRDPTQL